MADSSKDDIYGQVPDAGVDEVFSQAKSNLDKFFSNKINGPTTSKETDYPEEG